MCPYCRSRFDTTCVASPEAARAVAQPGTADIAARPSGQPGPFVPTGLRGVATCPFVPDCCVDTRPWHVTAEADWDTALRAYEARIARAASHGRALTDSQRAALTVQPWGMIRMERATCIARHMRRYHRDAPAGVVHFLGASLGTAVCPGCNGMFGSEQRVRAHTANCHGNGRPGLGTTRVGLMPRALAARRSVVGEVGSGGVEGGGGAGGGGGGAGGGVRGAGVVGVGGVVDVGGVGGGVLWVWVTLVVGGWGVLVGVGLGV